MKSFTFFLKEGKFEVVGGVVENFEFEGLSGRCTLTAKGALIESYTGNGEKVDSGVFTKIVDFVIRFMYYRVDANYHTIRQESNGFTILLGKLNRRRFPFMKQYKINNTWGIRCYNRKYDNAMCIEVFMLQVPWEEIVDNFVSHDKDEANKKFKEFVAKYKDKEAFT